MGGYKDMWLHTCDVKKRSTDTIDPTTRLLIFGWTEVLTAEPCDLSSIDTKVAAQGPNGTVYMNVQQPVLQIFPTDPADVPGNNDAVRVHLLDGSTRVYRVVNTHSDFDAGDGRYMGSVVNLEAPIPEPDNPDWDLEPW